METLYERDGLGQDEGHAGEAILGCGLRYGCLIGICLSLGWCPVIIPWGVQGREPSLMKGYCCPKLTMHMLI